MWAFALLPVVLAVFGTLGIWAVYGIAVANKTVNLTVEFPYISTCGSYPPQSCIFSQICNICCVLAMWVVTMRYQQVKDLGCSSRVNSISLLLGFVSSTGISMLGNFQQSVIMGVHLFGAFLAFFLGAAYFWLQVWLTYHAEPSQDRKWMGPLRIIFCSLCTSLVIAMAVLHNTGYRSAAAMCEWALVMIFFMLFGLFAAEFRHIDFQKLYVQKAGLTKSSSEWATQQSNVAAKTGHSTSRRTSIEIAAYNIA
ncbi:modulator of macroautophagy TMEM150B [Trichomycterus rosablanca]|uniref:modulator of macroautophagy TMEM150B n=1 Tax=Trichomycterus rosablanca TaxID=2290929 RepID=UPI002F35F239